MTTLRIGIDTQSTVGRKTGIGQWTTRLLQALRDFAPDYAYVPLHWGREATMRLHNRLYWQQWGVSRQAQQQQLDLLHVPGFDAPVWQPCPTILTVHDLIGMVFPHNLPPVSRFYWATWLPFTVRFAAHIMADSEHTRQDIIRLLNIPASRISVVMMGIEPMYQPLTDPTLLDAVRHKYQLPAQFILFVSTLEPRKGIDTLLDAFARLPNKSVGLVLAGKRGWYTDQIFAQLERLRLTDRVIFTDFVPDDDLIALYNAAELLAFPSRYEGYGLTVLEAMACGTPVVCSNASSLPEIAGDATILVPPDAPDQLAEAMQRVLDNPSLQAEMREKGRQQAARFTWAETAHRTIAVYEQVLQAGRHAR